MAAVQSVQEGRRLLQGKVMPTAVRWGCCCFPPAPPPAPPHRGSGHSELGFACLVEEAVVQNTVKGLE